MGFPAVRPSARDGGSRRDGRSPPDCKVLSRARHESEHCIHRAGYWKGEAGGYNSAMAIPPNLRKGVVLRIDGQPCVVLDYWEARTAQRRATLHVKIRDLLKGKVMEKTIDDRTDADVMESQVRFLQYLYSDASACHFMDVRTYDQFALPRDLVADREMFLIEETEYRVLFLEDRPVLVELPPTVTLDVVEAPPSAGTTSGNTDKVAVLRGGIQVKVPRFIQRGDRVRINTETLEYLGKE